MTSVRLHGHTYQDHARTVEWLMERGVEEVNQLSHPPLPLSPLSVGFTLYITFGDMDKGMGGGYIYNFGDDLQETAMLFRLTFG